MLADVDAQVGYATAPHWTARGGTGDTVRVAPERGIPVTVVWPDGARRDVG